MTRSTALRVVVGYAVTATLWILFSDTILHRAWPDVESHYQVGLIKGLGFVAVTSLILYGLMRRLSRAEVDRYRAFFERNHAVMLLIDPRSGRIIDANAAAAAFYGWTREQLRTMAVGEINTLPAEDTRAAMTRAMEGQQNVFHFRHRLANGETREVESHAGPVTIGDARVLCSIVHDVTERLRSETALRRQKDLYAALSEINQAVVRLPDATSIYAQICRTAVERAGFRFAWIGEIDADTYALRPVARYGEDGGYVDSIQVSADASRATGQGPAGTAIREGRAIVVNDFMRDESTRPWRDAAEQSGIRASGAFPIRRSGRVVAVLNVYAHVAGCFDDEVVSTLQEMATDVSFALDNAQRARREADAAAALAEAETRFRQIAENIREVFWLTDPAKNSMLYVSPAYETIWGRSCASLYASPRSWIEAIHPEDRERVLAAAQAKQAEGSYREEYRIVRPDGTIRRIRDHAYPVRDDEGNLLRVTGIAEDITENERMLEAVAEQEEKFRALSEQSLVGIFILDGDRIAYANPRTEQILGYGQGEIEGRSMWDFIGEADRPRIAQDMARLHSGEASDLKDEFSGMRGDGTTVMIGAHGRLASIAGRPVIMGVLQDITAKHQSEEMIRDYIARLERAMLGTVDAVSTMVELRDPYTAGHERRVGDLAAVIADEMGLDADMQQGLRIAGGVHDIGKIVVPAEILSKPGRLNPIEYEMVKTHAQQGYEVLKSIDFPWPVAEVARQHHERLDGSGYPRGLKGDEIILEARILAVADVVESMASHRPYRPGLGIEKALQEIESGAGRLYDPQATAACLRLFRDKGYALPE